MWHARTYIRKFENGGTSITLNIPVSFVFMTSCNTHVLPCDTKRLISFNSVRLQKVIYLGWQEVKYIKREFSNSGEVFL